VNWGDEPLFQALLASRPGLARALTPADRSRLAHAAQSNNTEAVRMMLAAGWPVDVRGQHGGTPLHWAAFHGNARMAEIILGYHPPLEWVDTDYRGTPLGWAIHGSEQGWHCRTGNYPGTVEALLQAGAKVPKKSKALHRSKTCCVDLAPENEHRVLTEPPPGVLRRRTRRVVSNGAAFVRHRYQSPLGRKVFSIGSIKFLVRFGFGLVRFGSECLGVAG